MNLFSSYYTATSQTLPHRPPSGPSIRLLWQKWTGRLAVRSFACHSSRDEKAQIG